MFQELDASLVFLAGVVGLCVGSFLNVVIHRLPKMLEREWLNQCAELRSEPVPQSERITLAYPHSRCPHCGHKIRALENIPLLSYVILKGRCAGCSAPISWRYPLIEALTGLVSAYTVWHFGPTVHALAALGLIWALIALTGIDLDTQLLPDVITLPLLWAGLLLNLSPLFADIRSAVIGAAVGYFCLWSVFWLFKLATGKEGMGYGDFKLLAALGAWLGWQMLPAIVLLSSVVGATVGITLILFTKQGRNTPIPFGPYLSAAGLLALFFGPQITTAYLGILS